jgi:hypothetical protein
MGAGAGHTRWVAVRGASDERVRGAQRDWQPFRSPPTALCSARAPQHVAGPRVDPAARGAVVAAVIAHGVAALVAAGGDVHLEVARGAHVLIASQPALRRVEIVVARDARALVAARVRVARRPHVSSGVARIVATVAVGECQTRMPVSSVTPGEFGGGRMEM